MNERNPLPAVLGGPTTWEPSGDFAFDRWGGTVGTYTGLDSFNRITDLGRFGVAVQPPGATILIAEITCQPGTSRVTEAPRTSPLP